MKKHGLLMMVIFLLISCGKQNADKTQENEVNGSGSSTELTDFQMEHGIGPITEPVKLNDKLNEKLINEGAGSFELKCSACHKLDSRYVGPPLGGITNTRTPAYLMNMMLNPSEMIEKHPIPKALLGEYATQMTNQNVSREEARAIVEYLASEDRK